MSFINNKFLNYKNLAYEVRSNSYIENYNRNIKLKMSEFLLGRKKCKINWPLFVYFLKEEEEYRIKNEEFLSGLIEKPVNNL